MFRVRHGQVTSLASAMLRMILTACFEGTLYATLPAPSTHKRCSVSRQDRQVMGMAWKLDLPCASPALRDGIRKPSDSSLGKRYYAT